jgi:hypothetical protein
LDHEVVDDAVKDRAVVVLVFDVLQKIGNRFGGFVGVHLDDKITFTRDELDTRRSLSSGGLPSADNQETSQGQDGEGATLRVCDV